MYSGEGNENTHLKTDHVWFFSLDVLQPAVGQPASNTVDVPRGNFDVRFVTFGRQAIGSLERHGFRDGNWFVLEFLSRELGGILVARRRFLGFLDQWQFDRDDVAENPTDLLNGCRRLSFNALLGGLIHNCDHRLLFLVVEFIFHWFLSFRGSFRCLPLRRWLFRYFRHLENLNRMNNHLNPLALTTVD